ncbi:HNH endonuclease signature motif containing protein [Actinomadura miaoliensis]|uniref:HNH nuclease domain-containing protein n=1 Tax=Actinomadura miaoliensis TaxID=430685 RepID=A0ABP7WR12_9ACTN
MNLSAITRDAILNAVAECDRLGQQRFLAQYGYAPSRNYWLHHNGTYYDSKAIVGVAYRHVSGRPLAADDFSGGRQTVGRLLTKLGFEVTMDKASTPHQRLLTAVKGLRVAGTPDGPARHQPLTLLWALGRAAHRRPRLVSWQDSHTELRGLFLQYGRPSSRPRPEFPWLALTRTELWELQGHTGEIPPASGEPIKWLEHHNPHGGLTTWAYELAATSDTARAAVITELGHRFWDGPCPEPLLKNVGLLPTGPVRPPAQPPSPVEEYLRLCQKIEAAEARGDHNRTTTNTRTQPVRSDDSRRAVLLRSNGRCENPLCAGQPDDVTDSGDPILEIDHIDDRSTWGRDHPEHMIALCPNCHAIKTRGRSRETLRPLLRTEARSRHTAWTSL